MLYYHKGVYARPTRTALDYMQAKASVRKGRLVGVFAAALPSRMLPLVMIALYQLVLKGLL